MQGAKTTQEHVEAMRKAPNYYDYHDDSIGSPDEKGFVTTSVQQKRKISTANRRLNLDRADNLDRAVVSNNKKSKKIIKEIDQQMKMNTEEIKKLKKQQKEFDKEFGGPGWIPRGYINDGKPITSNIFDNNDNPKDMEHFHTSWWKFFNFDDKQEEKKKDDLKF